MNQPEFAIQMEKLRLAFGTDLKTERVDFWFRIFQNFPQEVFANIVQSAINQLDRFPSIAQLRKFEDVAFGIYHRKKTDEARETAGGTECAYCDPNGYVTAPNGSARSCRCPKGAMARKSILQAYGPESRTKCHVPLYPPGSKQYQTTDEEWETIAEVKDYDAMEAEIRGQIERAPSPRIRVMQEKVLKGFLEAKDRELGQSVRPTAHAELLGQLNVLDETEERRIADEAAELFG